MKIAVPTENGILCPHFGHSPIFTIVEVNSDTKEIVKTEELAPPPHEPGVIPIWLGELQCSHIIAGGMGAMAVQLFEQRGIKVVMGAPPLSPEEIVKSFLSDSLADGDNPCDDPSFHEGHDHQCSSGE
ncbi:MAG: NifB/NifX family molybdenum-iron cluster-binding protein [candidate division Zixibacteria bacterium]|nr:NifB/NifX family molybdenum-iron cluster-binding protein [candidate division Zixibacteria bacterium]